MRNFKATVFTIMVNTATVQKNIRADMEILRKSFLRRAMAQNALAQNVIAFGKTMPHVRKLAIDPNSSITTHTTNIFTLHMLISKKTHFKLKTRSNHSVPPANMKVFIVTPIASGINALRIGIFKR